MPETVYLEMTLTYSQTYSTQSQYYYYKLTMKTKMLTHVDCTCENSNLPQNAIQMQLTAAACRQALAPDSLVIVQWRNQCFPRSSSSSRSCRTMLSSIEWCVTVKNWYNFTESRPFIHPNRPINITEAKRHIMNLLAYQLSTTIHQQWDKRKLMNME